MAGLLNLVVGGALKGAGDVMVEKARADREAAIAALTEQNRRTDMATAHNYESQNLAQQGQQQQTLETQREGFEGGQTDKQIAAQKDLETQREGFQGSQTDKEIGAANARSAAEIAGRHADVQTTASATVQASSLRASASEYRADKIADQATAGKPLTAGQAYLAARQAYTDNLHAQIPMNDSDGNAIPANEWISHEADRLMARQAAQRGAGGLINPYGASSHEAAPAVQVVQQPQMQAPQLQQPQAGPVMPNNSAVGMGGVPAVVPPIGAMDMLQKDPTLAPFFDQKYGQGAAATALGQRAN